MVMRAPQADHEYRAQHQVFAVHMSMYHASLKAPCTPQIDCGAVGIACITVSQGLLAYTREQHIVTRMNFRLPGNTGLVMWVLLGSWGGQLDAGLTKNSSHEGSVVAV